MNETDALWLAKVSSQRVMQLDEQREREREERDRCIRQASEAGVSVANLSINTGLTRTMLYKILDK